MSVKTVSEAMNTVFFLIVHVPEYPQEPARLWPGNPCLVKSQSQAGEEILADWIQTGIETFRILSRRTESSRGEFEFWPKRISNNVMLAEITANRVLDLIDVRE